MATGVMAYFYRRLGGRYPLAFVAVELQSALFVVAGTLGLFSFYYEGGERVPDRARDRARAHRGRDPGHAGPGAPSLRPLREWIDGKRDEESTPARLVAAVGMPLQLVKRDLPLPVFISVIPTASPGCSILDLSWLAIFPLCAGAGDRHRLLGDLHYLAVEAAMRPLLLDINSHLSPRLDRADFWAVPLRLRLLIALPMINLITGLVVAALTSDGGGGCRPRPRRAGRAAGRDDDLARAHGAALEVDPAPAARPRARRSSGCGDGDYDARCR